MKKLTTKGFTMIELLVALSVFTVVIGISSGIFIRALRSQRDLVDLIAVNDNASLSIEQIARELRVSSGFPTPGQYSRLDFTNAFSQAVSYRLNADTLERKVDTGNFEPITGSNVRVSQLLFIIDGTTPGDNQQPRVTILLGISPVSQRISSIITNVQTTVSPRALDN